MTDESNRVELKLDLDNEPAQIERRRILRGTVLVGSVASTVWYKPVINAVMLPAHAQTSSDTDTDTDSDQSDDQQTDDQQTDDQQTQLIDFFATTADATEVASVGLYLLDVLIPVANARQATNEEPLGDLKFEAEALDQGNGEYKIRIAAEKVADQNGRQAVTTRTFIFGWEGAVTNLNTPASLTGTGCAQNESAQITALSSSSLTIEMSYFSKTIALVLDAGSASLPTFPLSCV